MKIFSIVKQFIFTLYCYRLISFKLTSKLLRKLKRMERKEKT